MLYARLLGPLLAGYLALDRAFAYFHLPGTPLYVGEIVLGVGLVGALAATGSLLVPLREEPVLALLTVFVLWGLFRAVAGLGPYGIDAVRDSALWYYCLFAFLTPAALAVAPDFLARLPRRLRRLTPWLLLWLPFAVVLDSLKHSAFYVPFSTVSVLSHKPGNASIAALVLLGGMWLLPDGRSARSRAGWSMVAFLVIALAATQNRGGLLGVAAAGALGLVFMEDRLRLAMRAVLVVGVGLAVTSLIPVQIPVAGLQGRAFSSSQLVDNVLSLTGKESPGNLGGTVDGREQLWSRILDKQVDDGHLVDGSGFGPNLAAEVGIYDEGEESLRNPHNSHLDVLARMGLVGLTLWIAVWAGWYLRMVRGCLRLGREGPSGRRQIAVLSTMAATAILVSSFFDPQLEGPQVGILLWAAFGVGVAVTSTRTWCTYEPRPWPSVTSLPHRGPEP